MRKEEVTILLIEDDDGDIQLTRESLQDAKVLINLEVAKDGVQALKYLRCEAPYKHSRHPDLILLDLNIPKKDGREVLQEIKSDHELKIIPVIVLTTSDSDTDIMKTYDLGANCFITKPVTFENFHKLIQTIENFWFTVVKLPHPTE